MEVPASLTAENPITPSNEPSSAAFDLNALFDEHTGREFADRDVEATMATMVPEPYVYCVPVMTGGIGGQEVRRFYSKHFINQIPEDANVTTISRTIGRDQIAVELVLSFTHDTQWDYLLPGIPPTGKRVDLPHVVVMKFENGKVAHERLYWDQASLSCASWTAGSRESPGGGRGAGWTAATACTGTRKRRRWPGMGRLVRCEVKKEYDYVIVGGGSAGCVLAARLSEDAAVEVALIEAGPVDDAPEIHTPLAFPQLFKSPFDRDYSSEPEPALGGRRIYLPRGRVLGGSSSMNAMIYIRGNHADYDQWAADGATGWSYEELLPYFIRAEANERGASYFHGADGPLSVQEGRSQHPLMDRIITGFVQAGYPRNDDFNGASQLGAGRFQVTQNSGRRCSSAAAYLRQASARTNLEIIAGHGCPSAART